MVSGSAHEHAALVPAGSGGRGLRRRPHAEGPRTHQIVVRLSADEFAAIRVVTDRAGVVPGAWLGELGVRVAGGVADPVPSRWLDLVEDLVRCRQDVVEVVRLLGAAGGEDAATARRILARIDGITDAAAAAARSTR